MDDKRYLSKSSKLCMIAIAQAQAGDIVSAKKIADEIDDHSAKLDILSEIAKAQAQAGDIESAKKIAKETDDTHDKSIVLYTIAKTQAQAGDIESAKKIADEIDNHSYKSDILLEIAKAQAQMTIFSSALETLKEIFVNREYSLIIVATEIVDKGGTEEFKEILIPCSYNLVSAIQIVAMLFKVFPEQSKDISTRLNSVMCTVL